MENRNDVPYIVFEGELARLERTTKRLVTVLLITIALLAGTNIAWLWFFNQFDMTSTTSTQEAEGNANYIGANGSIINGESGN